MEEIGDMPTILFGAFDRHNLGDLLFPHVLETLLDKKQEPVVAGLAGRDLRPFGGHRVAALPALAARWGERSVNLVHAGGEILTCDAWQAAVMLLSPEQAQTVIARHDKDEAERLAWARRVLGSDRLAAYMVPKTLFRHPGTFVYNAVGGVDLDTRDPAFRAEVLDTLRAAEYVAVRDHITLDCLARAGISARLAPDPAVMVPELFRERISRHRDSAEIARLRERFPQGFAAIQFSADFGDDATLNTIAAQLDLASRATGLAMVFFRAGAAPWHDEMACYQSVSGRMSLAPFQLFESLNIWDICALIAESRVYCGSSLHGRILAMSFALPRLNMLHPAQTGTTKQAAYARTWDLEIMPKAVQAQGIAQGIEDALGANTAAMKQTAVRLSALYRQQFGEWSGLLQGK
jgi:hypothetical protein